MGLQSAMTTALTGLQAAETTIDVVGNNVANSNTVGFKESDVLFATQFLQTRTIGSSPSSTSGGTNPRQIGLGVKVAEIAPNFTQGTIQVSANPLDLAIQGDGFFIVAGPQGAGQELYTRNGQLKVNSENELVTLTGNRVLGYGVDDEFEIQSNSRVPLSIPLGGSQVAQQTENVSLIGNLLPEGQIGITPEIIQSVVLGDNSKERPIDLANNAISSLLPPDVSGTTTTAAGAVSGLNAGTYSYKIAFVDPNGVAGHDETPASVEIGPVTAALNDTVTLNNIPNPTDTDFTLMRIYRSDDSGVTYQLIEPEVPVANSYVDDTAAASGPALETGDLDFVNYSYFVTFGSTTSSLESRPTSQTSSVSISSENGRILLENLPKPTSTDFNLIKIYRNVNNEPGAFYLVDTLTPVAGTMNYIDSKSDDDISSGPLLDRNGPPISNSLELSKVSTFNGSSYVNLFELGSDSTVLQFTGSKGSPALDLTTKELQITATTTVQDLLTFMQQALGVETDSALTGNPGGRIVTDADGNTRLEFESNLGEQNELTIDESSFNLLVDGVSQGVPMDFGTTQEGNGEGSTSELVVFDSLGIAMNVRLTTVLESRATNNTTYRWFATSGDNQPADGVDTTVGTGTITFNGKGGYSSTTNSSITLQRQDVASVTPVTIAIDFSKVTALSVTNGDSSVQMTSQDGFPSGTLASFSITESGRIKGVYSNGVTRDLGQLVMARFANNGGLQQVGDNLWAQGVNSGEPLNNIPGTAGVGALTAGAVELSNTDIGQNLIDLILASTQYRGGTRVITSAQQLLDELLSLRR